jgi:epoxyqueuosine reductase
VSRAVAGSPPSLEARLRDQAARLGFAAVGFAAAGPARTFPIFLDWLFSGRAAGMTYLDRHAGVREDPRRLLPEARTVICAAVRYPANPSPGRGFSTYARNRDYHDVLSRLLRELVGWLRQERPELRARIAVDSAPVLEREWAARAGLGWIGRQGQLVNPAHGACLLLGEALTDLELEPSAPVAEQCGDCRRCVEACPTRAIGGDGHVDARRCLSYLTIEHDGAIPPELHAVMGTTIFGCDACTAVCPWNAGAAEDVLPELAPRPMPSAQELAAMDADAFQRRFCGTPVARSGLERLRRNARIALANAR